MSSQITIQPTFLLKGINPSLLDEDYNEEKLAKIIPEKKKIVPIALSTNRGKTFRDAIYTFHNKDNILQTIATTNVKNFTFLDQKGELRKGGKCNACQQEFTHESLGVPVRLTREGDKILVYTVYTTCSFGCTLRLTRAIQRLRNNNCNFKYSEQYLYFIYRRMYPDGPALKESPDPLLLELNGGSLKPEEYSDHRYKYIYLPNLIFYPAKEQYLRLHEQER